MKKWRLIAALSLPCLLTTASLGDLVHHYTLDGNADDVVAGWNGTMHNTTSGVDRNGQANGALHFDGTDAYVTMPNFESILNYDKDWSLNVWAKATLGTPEGSLFGGGDGGSGTKMFNFSAISNRVTNYADSSADYHVVDYDRYFKQPNGDGCWHMYTLTWDNAGVFTFYVDGAFFGQDTQGTLADYYPDTWIPVLGAGNAGFYGTVRGFFNGDIDDFRIYSHTLSQEDIDALCNPVPVPSALLLASIGFGVSSWRLGRKRRTQKHDELKTEGTASA